MPVSISDRVIATIRQSIGWPYASQSAFSHRLASGADILVTTHSVPKRDFGWFGPQVRELAVEDDGTWFVGLRDVGSVPIEVAASHVTPDRSEQVVTAYAASQPIIDVGPRGLDGFGWTPGDEVFVRIDGGAAQGPMRIDSSGQFSAVFATGPVSRGSTVEVVETGTGRVKSLHFLIELLFYQYDSRYDIWHVEARALKNAPGVAWVRYDDGSQSRTQFFDEGNNDGHIRTSFEDGDRVDFGVVSFQDPDGDWMTASYRLN